MTDLLSVVYAALGLVTVASIVVVIVLGFCLLTGLPLRPSAPPNQPPERPDA